jgi:hypothetical protein
MQKDNSAAFAALFFFLIDGAPQNRTVFTKSRQILHKSVQFIQKTIQVLQKSVQVIQI